MTNEINIDKLKTMAESPEYGISDIEDELGVSKTLIYKHLDEHDIDVKRKKTGIKAKYDREDVKEMLNSGIYSSRKDAAKDLGMSDVQLKSLMKYYDIEFPYSEFEQMVLRIKDKRQRRIFAMFEDKDFVLELLNHLNVYSVSEFANVVGLLITQVKRIFDYHDIDNAKQYSERPDIVYFLRYVCEFNDEDFEEYTKFGADGKEHISRRYAITDDNIMSNRFKLDYKWTKEAQKFMELLDDESKEKIRLEPSLPEKRLKNIKYYAYEIMEKYDFISSV